MRNRLAALLMSGALLSACADEATRREFIYKPAYCLAGGLAQMGSEDCLPSSLKENAAAVATARLKDATGEKPSEDLRVYYTDDQRLAMSHEIARRFFAPDATLTQGSVAMSLEAAGVLEPEGTASTACGAAKARKDTVGYAQSLVADAAIHRETAKFLAEHYTDLQLTELYRVARSGGALKEVKDDAFIMPDPKHAQKTVNVKPKTGTELGGILSYATSRVASRAVAEHKQPITAQLAEATARRKAAAAKKDASCADAPADEPAAKEPHA